MQGEYAVYIRSKDGTLTGRINEYIRLHMIMTLNEPGIWDLTSLSREKCPFAPGDGIIVIRNGAFLFGGVMTEMSDEFNATTGLHKWQVQGKGDLEYLNRRICYVDPVSGRTNIRTHYTDSGKLSVVISGLIYNNIGPGAMDGRRDPIIANYTDSLGPDISVSLRFQNLLTAVRAYVTANGWNVRANWDNTNDKIYYSIFQGRDLTADIVFTEQFSNITAAEHLATVPAGNFILAGGTGQGIYRYFAEAEDDSSVSEWGRIEVFQDARNQTDLSGYADEVLADKTADTIGYGCTASDDDLTPQFGTDYLLGDYVGMRIFDQLITAQVQQCEITVEDSVENVEPRFGTVAIGKLRSLFQRLNDLRMDVNELLGKEVE